MESVGSKKGLKMRSPQDTQTVAVNAVKSQIKTNKNVRKLTNMQHKCVSILATNLRQPNVDQLFHTLITFHHRRSP